MTVASLLSTDTSELTQRTFERRSLLHSSHDYLWQIESGIVRTLTWFENGTASTLGLWGPGDIVGSALSTANPYQIECLTPVEVRVLPKNRWYQVTEAMILHMQRLEEFLEILHCKPVDAALLRLLTWLAKRFGRNTAQGQLIELRLTHQEMAELLGSTRVTITRLLSDFERRGIIQRHRRFVVLHEQQPFWHYEI